MWFSLVLDPADFHFLDTNVFVHLNHYSKYHLLYEYVCAEF